MSDHCKSRFTTWINQKSGGAMLGQVVVAEYYDEAIEALKSSLAQLEDNLHRMQTNQDGIGPDCTAYLQAMLDANHAIAKAIASNS